MVRAKLLNIIGYLKANKKASLSTFLILLLIASFTFSGLFASIARDGSWVLKVGDEYVGRKQFEGELSVAKKSLGYTMSEQEIKQKVFDRFAMKIIFAKEMKAHGINIEDETILKIIKENPIFLKDGVFSVDLFKDFLIQNRVTEEDYINYLKLDLSQSVVMDFASYFLSSNENLAKVLLKSRTEKRIFDLYTIAENKIRLKQEPSNELISDYYNKNRALFKTDSVFSVEYISGVMISEQVSYNPDKKTLEKLRNTYKQLKESDIVRIAKDAHYCQIIRNISKIATSSEAFDDLARSYGLKPKTSEIVLSEKNAKYAVLDGMKKGDVTTILHNNSCLETQVVRVKSVKDGEFLKFDDVKSKVTSMVRKQEQEKAAKILIDEFKDVRKQGISESVKWLKANGFSSENTSLNRYDQQQKISYDLLKDLFTIEKGNFTGIHGYRQNGVYQAALFKDVISAKEPSKAEIEKLAKEISGMKIIDIYQLYYMSLRVKYDIKINEDYFNNYVAK
ncbi:Peptidyl-prolyl cis-trans isomerase D [Candidatus Deianiraea vastatrix]|uniref:Peptidyl-prolyl cis-trans isomerase D n=2 Tax=Candidatus Deianiraea vastatrix TaxID=2163644 RepID=A0A5B8XEN3_9RICK|nr:Peptidyl-prolyl cis-trans isomerase D [Candidatus Deianiraea vastatrix]